MAPFDHHLLLLMVNIVIASVFIIEEHTEIRGGCLTHMT